MSYVAKYLGECWEWYGMSGVQRPKELCIINNGELGCAPGSKQERADMCCARRLRTEFEKGTTEKCPATEGHAGNSYRKTKFKDLSL